MLVAIELLLALLAAVSSAASKSLSSDEPNWQKWGICCQLTYEFFYSALHIEKLPADALLAGNFSGHTFVYAWSLNGDAGVKSEIPHEAAINLVKGGFIDSGILLPTNTNNCTLGWYKTVFARQNVFTDIEAATGWRYLLNPKGWEYTYFTRYNGYPGVLLGSYNGMQFMGENYYINGSLKRTRFDEPGIEVMYVDCVRSASRFELASLTLDSDDVASLNRSEIIYFEKTFENPSDKPVEETAELTADYANSIEVEVGNNYTLFDWSVNQEVSEMIANLSKQTAIDLSKEVIEKLQEGNSSTAYSLSKSVFMPLRFKVAPRSLATVKVAASPIRGQLRAALTFELQVNDGFPIIKAIDWLYKYQKLTDSLDLVISNRTVVVNFAAKINIDAGYFVTADIQSAPLSN